MNVQPTGLPCTPESPVRESAGRFLQAYAAAQAAHNGVPPVAVSIVSNSTLLSEGLFALLATRLPLEVVARYPATLPGPLTDENSQALPNPPGHVVLIDGSVGRHGAQVWTHYWCTRTPPAHVVVLEMSHDVELIVDCIAAGVGGYILQGDSIDDVVRVIGEVQQGRAQCSPEVTGRLCARLMSAHQKLDELSTNVSPLTPRELEVLQYIDRNLSNQEIAAILVIEVRTVKHHVHNILEKLGLTNRQAAARLANQHGWLRAP
jgi:DNA-binding NarL/FixJ family response regulator